MEKKKKKSIHQSIIALSSENVDKEVELISIRGTGWLFSGSKVE